MHNEANNTDKYPQVTDHFVLTFITLNFKFQTNFISVEVKSEGLRKIVFSFTYI